MVVQVSLTFVELMVTWDADSPLSFALDAWVTSASTEVVLVTVDVTAGTRDEHSLAAAVFDARQPSPRRGDASQALTLALTLKLALLALNAELALKLALLALNAELTLAEAANSKD